MMKQITSHRAWVVLALVLSLLFVSCNVPTQKDNSAELTTTMQALNSMVSGTQTALAVQAQATPQPQVPTDTPKPLEAPTATPPPSATPILHNLFPAEPGGLGYWIWDRDSSSTANEKRAPGGDSYSNNQYERPFTQTEMRYRPDLDITRADLTDDANFYYVLITLYDVNPDTKGLEGAYGVEIDLDKDGRGDTLVMADKPFTTAWDTLHVRAYTDSNNDVGGPAALSSDAPFTSANGYDQMLFAVEIPTDPDLAWGRMSPSNPRQIQIAFRKSLINGATQFLWGVFADDALRAPEKMDYNDYYTLAQAGSPLINAPDYPLKEVHSFDNTCRLAYGFSPTGSEPGLCKPADPTPTPTPTNPPNFVPGTVHGRVWFDNNGNGNMDPGEPGFGAASSVVMSSGACAPVMVVYQSTLTNTSGYYVFSGIPAGTYCVSYSTAYTVSTSRSVTVNIVSGSNFEVNFGLVPPGK
ncbi:MAG TPA: SdrD B-like domain-containing protein [Anaerolineaceae bacterium]|nr:SdrD B-like domain-containing protein [Anaerolineaceae bacterium]